MDNPSSTQNPPPPAAACAAAWLPPSIQQALLVDGVSYTHHSAIPRAVTSEPEVECTLGVDEAGRGPVLGPMVYGLCYLPKTQHRQLLAETHHFDDSKVLTPAFRTELLRTLCDPASDLYGACGWATRVMSARDIGEGMLRSTAVYNLNAQAMDATVQLIREVLDQGVNITEIFIDTIGNPATYQRRLEHIFPTVHITVAKKADSLYPVVSAASVCAKVTRDLALEELYKSHCSSQQILSSAAAADATAVTSTPDSAEAIGTDVEANSWGSGYPSDARCTTWLKNNIDPVFGWGAECRFSWATAAEMLDRKGVAVPCDWPTEDEENRSTQNISSMFATLFSNGFQDTQDEGQWYGTQVTPAMLALSS